MSAEETEDERNDRLNREIWRRMQQTSEEWKVEELMKLYQPDFDGWDLFDAQIAGRAREELQEILKAKWTREEPRVPKQVNGTEKPCPMAHRIMHYMWKANWRCSSTEQLNTRLDEN